MNTQFVTAAAAHLRVGPGQTRSTERVVCADMHVVGVRVIAMKDATPGEMRTVAECCRVRVTIDGRTFLECGVRFLDAMTRVRDSTPPGSIAAFRLAKSDEVVVSVAYEPPPPPTLGARILLRMPIWVRVWFLALFCPLTPFPWWAITEQPEPLRRELAIGVVLDGYSPRTATTVAPLNGRT